MLRTSTYVPHKSEKYVLNSTRILSDMLAHYRGPKSRTSLEVTSASSHGDEEDSHPALVLPSSTELFYFYAQTLDQCAKLFTGQPLYDLCNLHKKWLKIYAGTSSHAHLCYEHTDHTTNRGRPRRKHEEVRSPLSFVCRTLTKSLYWQAYDCSASAIYGNPMGRKRAEECL